MNKRINIKSLIISIDIALALGGVSALITAGSIEDFAALKKPPLSPPGWLFPAVWTVLYVLMGIAFYLVLRSQSAPEEKRSALKVYFIQLAFNFLWSPIFFTLGAYELAFLWLVILLALIVATVLRFWHIDKRAGAIMLPYVLWVSFAAYLNLAIAGLN